MDVARLEHPVAGDLADLSGYLSSGHRLLALGIGANRDHDADQPTGIQTHQYEFSSDATFPACRSDTVRPSMHQIILVGRGKAARAVIDRPREACGIGLMRA